MVLRRHGYFELGKGQRGVLFNYMLHLTGYTRQHLTKLVARYRQERHLLPVTRASRTSFSTRFGRIDDVVFPIDDMQQGPLAEGNTRMTDPKPIEARL